MTATEVQTWLNEQNGQWHDFDGFYGAQCTDLAQFYSQFLGGHRFWGNAINFYDQPGSFYTQIANSPDPANIPQLGDIVIWDIGTYGHVAICISADANGLTTLDQNWYTANDSGSVAVVVRHDWTSRKVKGWLRPKLTEPSAQGGSMADENTVRSLYQLILLRDADAGGLSTYVGMDTGKVFWSLLTSDEYKTVIRARQDQQNAQRALEADLRTRISELQTLLTNEQNKPAKEIIKEVQVIVEKPVEVIKEVEVVKEVYTHDEETKKTVMSIKMMLVNFIGWIKGKLGK